MRPFALDTTSPEVAQAIAAVEADPGRLDVLVNNAAAFVDWSETASTADLDSARAVMDTNLYGTWRVTQAALPLLRASALPRVVVVGSGAGSHSDPTFQAHGARRCGSQLRHQQGSARRPRDATELAGSGILVNTVCPGLTATYQAPRPWARARSPTAPPAWCGQPPSRMTAPRAVSSATASRSAGDSPPWAGTPGVHWDTGRALGHLA